MSIYLGDTTLADELQFLLMRDQPSLVREAEKTPNALASALTVIERPMVHVHADKFIREFLAHVARKL